MVATAAAIASLASVLAAVLCELSLQRTAVDSESVRRLKDWLPEAKIFLGGRSFADYN